MSVGYLPQDIFLLEHIPLGQFPLPDNFPPHQDIQQLKRKFVNRRKRVLLALTDSRCGVLTLTHQ